MTARELARRGFRVFAAAAPLGAADGLYGLVRNPGIALPSPRRSLGRVVNVGSIAGRAGRARRQRTIARRFERAART